MYLVCQNMNEWISQNTSWEQTLMVGYCFNKTTTTTTTYSAAQKHANIVNAFETRLYQCERVWNAFVSEWFLCTWICKYFIAEKWLKHHREVQSARAGTVWLGNCSITASHCGVWQAWSRDRRLDPWASWSYSVDSCGPVGEDVGSWHGWQDHGSAGTRPSLSCNVRWSEWRGELEK